MLVLIGRLAQLQAVQSADWRARASGIQEQTIELPAQRGSIFDSNGILLAVDVKGKSIAVDGRNLVGGESLIDILSDALGLTRAKLRQLVERDSYFTWIERNVDLDVALEIVDRADAAGIRGLILVDTWTRRYPQGSLASNLLGFVGVDGAGLEGLELHYDDVLRGHAGSLHIVEGRDGRTYELATLEEAVPGRDLHLTLDARVQSICEAEIDRGTERFAAESGFIVVLDPGSGEILAMAQSPRYDPNHFAASEAATRRNLAVTTVFEPGSTFKVFTGLAALAAGAASLEDRFDGNDGVRVTGHVMHNADNVSYGTVSFGEIIEKSINTAMIRVAQRVGSDRLHEMLVALGFGQRTGVELPGEVAGILRPAEEWVPLDLAATAIGQSVAVTGIQLARAVSAVASGGILHHPSIIAADQLADVSAPRRVASEEQAALMRKLLRRVVETGTGTLAEIPGFRVAGKTGTAQKAAPGVGYSAGKYTSLFAGFLPADDPALVALVVLDEVGTGTPSGGYTAGQIFRSALSQTATALRLAPASPSGSP